MKTNLNHGGQNFTNPPFQIRGLKVNTGLKLGRSNLDQWTTCWNNCDIYEPGKEYPRGTDGPYTYDLFTCRQDCNDLLT